MSMAETEIDCEHGGTIHSCPVCIREREGEVEPDPWNDIVRGPQWRPLAGGFEAKYESDCPECEDLIEIGDMIFMRDGRAVCEACS